MLRLDGLLDKGHSGLPGSSASFFHVAFCAGTNYIFPNRLASHTLRDNVVKRQLAGSLSFAAILTSAFIASEDVSPIKFHLVSGQTVVK